MYPNPQGGLDWDMDSTSIPKLEYVAKFDVLISGKKFNCKKKSHEFFWVCMQNTQLTEYVPLHLCKDYLHVLL